MDLFAWTMLARWLLGWLLLWRVPGLGAAPSGSAATVGDGPLERERVSVVIPCRDEALLLPGLLAALARQDQPAGQIVVVDDHSTDGTADAGRAGGAMVVTAPDLPAGWTGKNWAAWHGAALASGDVIVFLDADTLPAPDFLQRLTADHRVRGGLLSVQPYHRMRRADERLAALFNVLGVMGSGLATPWHHITNHDVFGPAIVTSRADYFAVGGHEAVRAEVVEDRALGRRYASAGLPVGALGGRDALSFRMYPRGLGALVEGFTKNFFAGASGTPFWWLLLIVAWVSGTMVAAWAGPVGLVQWAVGGPGPTGLELAYYVAFAGQLAVMLRPLGNFRWTWLVFPVPLVFFLGVFVLSVFAAIRGSVSWKGRRVSSRRGGCA